MTHLFGGATRGGAALVLAACVALVGCSSKLKTHTVKGTVVFKEDGKPLGAGCTVTFQSLDNPELLASGEVEEGGAFTMHSITGTAGVVAGEHKVMITPPRPEYGETPKGPVPARYQRAETTDLHVTVKPGANDVKIELERGKR